MLLISCVQTELEEDTFFEQGKEETVSPAVSDVEGDQGEQAALPANVRADPGG